MSNIAALKESLKEITYELNKNICYDQITLTDNEGASMVYEGGDETLMVYLEYLPKEERWRWK